MTFYHQLQQRIHDVNQRLKLMRSYLRMRDELNDWHGVMDAAADIRELETELRTLQWVITNIGSNQ